MNHRIPMEVIGQLGEFVFFPPSLQFLGIKIKSSVLVAGTCVLFLKMRIWLVIWLRR